MPKNNLKINFFACGSWQLTSVPSILFGENNSYSTLTEIKAGVLQGSALRPVYYLHVFEY